MSDWLTQENRKANNIAAAVEAMRESGMPTPRTDEALAEPVIGDDHKVAAIAGDLAESCARLSQALDHVDTHVTPSQKKELERLQARVEKLEPKPKGSGDSKGSGGPKAK